MGNHQSRLFSLASPIYNLSLTFYYSLLGPLWEVGTHDKKKHISPSSLALSRVVRIEGQMDVGRGEDGRRYQLTQGLPLASGNTAGTNGPSSERAEGIASESSSAGNYLSVRLRYEQLMLPRPTTTLPMSLTHLMTRSQDVDFC